MIQIIDNFYTQDIINNLKQLSVSCLNDTCGNSNKSDDLSIISPSFNEQFCKHIFAMFNLKPSQVFMNNHLTKNIYKENQINGRIHIDGRNPFLCEVNPQHYKLLFCGIIFISDVIDTNSGISFYEVKPENNWTKQEEFQITLDKCYTYNSDELERYHENFNETVNVKNVTNRFVSWKAGTKHKMCDNSIQKERVTQNFYISLV